jgi:uncharacterized XkdX family phage protein
MAKKHSDKYETVKKYYTMGMWDKQRVRNAVTKGWITEEEFTEITGEPYSK